MDNTYKVRLEALLRNKIHNMDLFLNALRSCRGVISGSYLLQAYYDEEWENSDIDIFVAGLDYEPYYLSFFGQDYTPDNPNPLFEFLTQNNYELIPVIPKADQQLTPKYLEGKDNGFYRRRYGIMPGISLTFSCDKQYAPLNIVFLDGGINVIDYINKYFDFSICKGYYDRNYFISAPLDQLITRTTYVNRDMERFVTCSESLEQVETDNRLYLTKIKNAGEEALKRRIEIYTKRGFSFLN